MSLAETTWGTSERPLILERLKRETRGAHDRLEAGLDLLQAPLGRDRFVRLLERFWGFHAIWEPAVGRALADDAFLEPRLKLHKLEADLFALGRTPDEIARLPRCFEAAQLAPLARRPAAALGTLYVLEGSTLGGQVISRALKTAPWLPPGGLAYFDPYGPRTGAMWRDFRDYAAHRSTPAADAEMLAAAKATFERLRRWLT
jgi:heme oxygenase (biliverdin-IX-beta and delta-forming)